MSLFLGRLVANVGITQYDEIARFIQTLIRLPCRRPLELISSEKLIQTQAETHGVERNNFRQRHWLGRFRRKTCIVSRSLEMVELPMTLFARFRVNETPYMISSFFS
jgi:hypothetical protein